MSMKDAPAMDFSLVITNYNRERFIDRAIRSCLMQIILRRPIEIIVVDDASTDGSLDIIREFSHDVQVFEQDRNQGVAAASNVGLANASGRYWMRVDADDFLNTYACAFLGSILDENPDIDFVYCDHHRVDLRGVKCRGCGSTMMRPCLSTGPACCSGPKSCARLAAMTKTFATRRTVTC